MNAADKLAQVLAEHESYIRNNEDRTVRCDCGHLLDVDFRALGDPAAAAHRAHVAAAVLAHLTAEGWAQGRDEWGVAGPGDKKPFMWGLSRADAEVESGADGYRVMHRTAAYTEWEAV